MNHTDIQKDPAFKVVFKGFALDHRWEEFIAKIVHYVLSRKEIIEDAAGNDLGAKIKQAYDLVFPIPNLFRDAILPHPDHLTLALVEEEVMKTVFDFRHGKISVTDVHRKLIQTAAMCLRLAQEGDPTVGLPPMER